METLGAQGTLCEMGVRISHSEGRIKVVMVPYTSSTPVPTHSPDGVTFDAAVTQLL